MCNMAASLQVSPPQNTPNRFQSSAHIVPSWDLFMPFSHFPCRAYLGDASFESDVVESLMQALAEDEGNDEVSAQAAAPKVSVE